MKLRPLIFAFTFYTLFMFLAGQFVISPEKSVANNILFALLAGILFIILFGLINWYIARRKGSGK